MDRVLEEGHIRVGRIAGAGFGRLRGRVRIPVRLSHGKGTERAGSSLQLLQSKRLPKLRLRRSRCLGSRLRCSASPTRSGAEPSPSAAAACRRSSSARARAAASRVCRSASCRMRVLERPPHPVIDGSGLGQEPESGRIFLGTRHRPREEESADEHGDQHHAGLGHDAARQGTFRAAGPTASSGSSEAVPCAVNRQAGPLVADLQPPVGQHMAGDVEAVLASGRKRRAPARRPGAHRGPATPGRASAGR